MEGGRLKDLFSTPPPPPEGGQEGGESLGEKFCKESNFLQHVYVLHMYIDFDLPQLHLKFHNKIDIILEIFV